MRRLRQVLVATGLIAGVALAGGAQAAKFKVLTSFGFKLGTNPMGPVLIDSAGNLFGTASQAGPQLGGTVYELKRKGGGYKAISIFRFCISCGTGQQPTGPLIIDTQGNLYGTADSVAFELSPVPGQKIWSEKILYQFCSQASCTDGDGPVGGLTYAGASGGAPYDGASPLYGATAIGGANNGGAVFQLTNNSGIWSESVLYSFCSQGGENCTDGTFPFSGLLIDASGNLFGTTLQGGAKQQAGVVFELSEAGEAWNYKLLHTFCSQPDCTDGAEPDGAFTFDATGALLGTTGSGGASCRRPKTLGCGTVFRLVPNGANSQLTVLHSFCQQRDCNDGAGPEGGVAIDSSGNLYGTTGTGGGQDTSDAPLGGGITFMLSDTAFKVLHRFCSSANCIDGKRPESGVTFDSLGNLIVGTTEAGGQSDDGIVFKVNLTK